MLTRLASRETISEPHTPAIKKRFSTLSESYSSEQSQFHETRAGSTQFDNIGGMQNPHWRSEF